MREKESPLSSPTLIQKMRKIIHQWLVDAGKFFTDSRNNAYIDGFTATDSKESITTRRDQEKKET